MTTKPDAPEPTRTETRTREQIAHDYYVASGRGNSEPKQATLDRIDAAAPAPEVPAGEEIIMDNADVMRAQANLICELRSELEKAKRELAKWKGMGFDTPEAVEMVLRCGAEMARTREAKIVSLAAALQRAIFGLSP